MIATKNKLILFVALGCLIIAALFFFNGSKTVSTDNAYTKSDITIIRPKVTGHITEILVKDNQKINNGDLIAKIDDRDYKLKLQEAQSNLDATKSRLDSIDDKLAIQEFKISKTSFIREGVKASFERAQKDFSRSKSLLNDKAISQKDLDKDYEVFTNAKNNFDAANSDYEIELLQKNILLKEKQETSSLLEQSEARLGLAKLDLENTLIKATVDGVINNKTLQIGQLVSPNIALAYIVQNNIWVIANFKETQITHVKINNEATLEIDSLPGYEFKGKVESLSPASGAEFSILPPENATGNFTKIVQRVPVKITFNNEQDLSNLRPGLSVTAIIKLN